MVCIIITMMTKIYLFIYLLQNEEQSESVDAQVVKQAVLQAIKNWSESTDQQE